MIAKRYHNSKKSFSHFLNRLRLLFARKLFFSFGPLTASPVVKFWQKSLQRSRPKFYYRARVFFVAFMIFVLLPNFLQAQEGIDQNREELQKKLNDVQNRIEVYRGQIQQKQSEAVSLKSEIGILEDQMNQSQLEIEQIELAMNELSLEINDREKEITGFHQQIDEKKKVLTECLRVIYEYDQTSLAEIILQQENFSDFFNEIQAIESLQTKMQTIVNDLNALKKGVEDQKNVLEEQKNEQGALRMLQEAQKRFSQAQEQKKNNLLAQTKGQEALFKRLMDKAYLDVAGIKKQIYNLEGAGVSMTLEEALQRAEFASSKTGVRPAFLLAVLKKESSWGTNVGTGFWRSDMHSRDHNAFVAICQKLGFDPDQMPVSRKPSYGWGGAMGPAQFLPSVWLSYEDEIARLTGHNPPNPWNTDDAFVAAGLKLSKNGAAAKSYDAEWKAAMIYFAGKRWNKSVYRFYGDSVMELAKVIQDQINIIKGK